MRKYTRKSEFPCAEIHAEMCITACGNTLNQVPKNSPKRSQKKEEEHHVHVKLGYQEENQDA